MIAKPIETDDIYRMVENSDPDHGHDTSYQVGYLSGMLRLIINGEMSVDEARAKVESAKKASAA